MRVDAEGNRFFTVAWVGYPEDTSEEPEENLEGAEEFLAAREAEEEEREVDEELEDDE